VAAGERAEAAAEQVAGHAHGRRRSRDRGEPVLGRRRDDGRPLRTAADRRRPGARVDAHRAEPPGGDEQAAADGLVRAVAGALHADAQALFSREGHGPDDVVGAGRGDHEVGGVLDVRVESGDLRRVVRVLGDVDGAADEGTGEC
jgi:hypothetical protein